MSNEADYGNKELHNRYEGFVGELDGFEEDYEYKDTLDYSNPYDSDSGDLFGNRSDNDRDLHDYESRDNNGDDSDDDVEEQTCIIYKENIGGFEFNSVGDEIV